LLGPPITDLATEELTSKLSGGQEELIGGLLNILNTPLGNSFRLFLGRILQAVITNLSKLVAFRPEEPWKGSQVLLAFLECFQVGSYC